MRILLTGGAGFLGSHLADTLLEKGHEVIVIDNFYTGSKDNLKHQNMNKNLEILRHDVTMPFNVEVDFIFNLACPASPIHYQKHPVQTIKTSILGAINVLDLAHRLMVPVLQASTSEVYGDPVLSPQPEEYWGNVNPIGIRSCYDEGKRAAESLFFDFHRQFGTRIKVARIFNTYGPRMTFNDGRVISNFIVQALNNKDLTIYGDGKQTRSFCYVSDLILGLTEFMFSHESVTGPINLGNPHEFTILEIAEKVLYLTNSKSKIIFKELPEDDPKQRRPDITKAKDILKFDTRVNLEAGLEKTIQDFSTRMESQKPSL